MRLAATLTTVSDVREEERKIVALRGTLRDGGQAPREIVILDVSASGFLAELPRGVKLKPGTSVRVAATQLGVHEAVVVRQEAGCHGFAFAVPLPRPALTGLDGEQVSSVAVFPGDRLPAPATPQAVGGQGERAPLSPRASLALMIGISSALWGVLATVVMVTRPLL